MRSPTWCMLCRLVTFQTRAGKQAALEGTKELDSVAKGVVTSDIDNEMLVKSTGSMGTVMRKHMAAITRKGHHTRVLEEPTELSREVFLQWWVDHLRGVRRKLLMESLRIFDELDCGTIGRLDRKTFETLVRKSTGLDNYPQSAHERLDKDKVFDTIPKKNVEAITRDEFEEAWGEHIGYDGPSLPLLPEHMAKKINETAIADVKHYCNRNSEVAAYSLEHVNSPEHVNYIKYTRTAKELWEFLRVRLRLLVSFQARQLSESC